MGPIRMVMFDLSGTTVYDEGFVTDCLHQAAQEVGIAGTKEFIARNIGTNKRHLFRFLIARERDGSLDLKSFASVAMGKDDEALADRAFDVYEQLMLKVYRRETKEVPGASDTFRWLHDRNILVATDTGFHRAITDVIMEKLGWLRDGLVDLSVNVQDIPGEIGRPAPYMLFHAMQRLGVHAVENVVKVGDQPADLMEGTNAGCRGVVGVLSGSAGAEVLGGFRHTHLIPSVADLPRLIADEFSEGLVE